MEFSGNVGEKGYAAEPRSAVIFLGTGCSNSVPNARCLIQPSDPPCQVCFSSLALLPDRNPNYRCNTSLLVDFCGRDGEHHYVLIDVGKTFREQVLRWFTFHKIPRIDSIVLTHEHADAVLGLDDIRAVQPHSPTNDIAPTPIYLTQEAMDSIGMKFPYLVQKKLKEGQEVRRVSQLEWKIIENDYISESNGQQLDLLILDTLRKKGSHNVHFCLPQSLDAVKRLRPKRALLIGMSHEFDHHKDNEFLREWSTREGIPVQLAHDGLRIPVDL
ncbi:putative hydrolase C777.06c isoform X2 [Rhododendron vialii]|uniref:putative hydrolase C777.06c isoform X2 n=1 Tax=Rhododendron vialii TaxID=182163 RepID=UPI00265E527A|nr:putative hydrolase C777.06c isoform X2 [Rhododendron vialii]